MVNILMINKYITVIYSSICFIVNTTPTDLAEYTDNFPLNNETVTRKEICTIGIYNLKNN